MSVTFDIAGLKESEEALKELPKASHGNVLRRALRKAVQPFVTAAKERAPRDTGRLAESIRASFRLTKRQQRLERQLGQTPDDVKRISIHVGPVGKRRPSRIGWLTEYGTRHRAPTPYMRPAWDATQAHVLSIFRDLLASEIFKEARRIERKMQRIAK